MNHLKQKKSQALFRCIEVQMRGKRLSMFQKDASFLNVLVHQPVYKPYRIPAKRNAPRFMNYSTIKHITLIRFTYFKKKSFKRFYYIFVRKKAKKVLIVKFDTLRIENLTSGKREAKCFM